MAAAEAWSKLRASCCQEAMGRMFRVQGECMYPTPATQDTCDHAVGRKWKTTMTKVGDDVKVLHLWRMSMSEVGAKQSVKGWTTLEQITNPSRPM